MDPNNPYSDNKRLWARITEMMPQCGLLTVGLKDKPPLRMYNAQYTVIRVEDADPERERLGFYN